VPSPDSEQRPRTATCVRIEEDEMLNPKPDESQPGSGFAGAGGCLRLVNCWRQGLCLGAQLEREREQDWEQEWEQERVHSLRCSFVAAGGRV
jgi:hypothetical protein